jgi:DNA-binding beta-propeller fold protein YncE
VALGVALVIASAFPATAMADGLPIPGVYTDPAGVAAPGGKEHYVTRQEGDDSTVVRALGQNGRLLRSTTVSGRFVIPAVALDGSPGGLSADETTLVLIQPRRRFPQSETHLEVLDAPSLVLKERRRLRGDFSFDAISPDGSHIYLIEYLSRRDPTEYACAPTTPSRGACSRNRSSTRTRRATRCAATP